MWATRHTSLPQPREEMPILTPSYLPHPPGLSPPSPFRASSKATCLAAPSSQAPTPPTSPKQDAVTQRSDAPPPKRERSLKILSVKLDLPSIQDNMAASLAIALLGHVLFSRVRSPCVSCCARPRFYCFLFFFWSHGLLQTCLLTFFSPFAFVFIQPRCATGTHAWWNVRIACGQEALGHGHSVR